MSDEMKYKPLTRDEVAACIERKGCDKIPVVMCKWWGEGTYEKYGSRLDTLDALYPNDVFEGWFLAPGGAESTNDNPSYRWGYRDNYDDYETHSIGKAVELLKDWEELDAFLADFPNPYEEGTFQWVQESLPQAEGRYKLGCFWRVFHEKLWEIRGMENLMCDYYDHMDELKIVGRKLLDFHKVIVDRFAELGFDGIFTSDDLGHQTSAMMSPAVFEELYLPLYRELIAHTHNRGMHFWLHSCGDNTVLMDYLVQAGLDVFHPVQKGCMDEKATAEQYGGSMSFMYGIDVQHLLPDESPEQITREIERMAKLFHTEKGGLIFAAGNGIMPDTPIENIEAMLKAVYRYR